MDAFCAGFTDFILKVKTPLDYTNLFSSNEYERKDKYNYTIFKRF